jgi:hypothetical protein
MKIREPLPFSAADDKEKRIEQGTENTHEHVDVGYDD